MIPTLFILSLVGGFLSGLLGIGGAVVMIPLMLSVPPLLGLPPFSMAEASGLSMLLALASSVSGCLAHRREGFVHHPSLLMIGLPMGAFALVGAYASQYMSDHLMLTLFAILTLISFVLLLLETSHTDTPNPAASYVMRKPRSITVGSIVGFLAGVVGAGGGFVMIPLMISVLKMPVRLAVGSSLGIVFIGALMGSIGKILALQVAWAYLPPVILGALPAAQIGARVSNRMRAEQIRRLLLAIVFLCLLKTVWDLVFR